MATELSMMVVMTSSTFHLTFSAPGSRAYSPPAAMAASSASSVTSHAGASSCAPTTAAAIAPR